MTRTEIHESFTRRFGSKKERTVFTTADVERIDSEFSVHLPGSYCAFATTHGTVCCPLLLDLIVDQESSLWDVAEFLPPQEVISNTQLYASGGMSDKIIGFAGDSMGNMFGFDRRDIAEKKDDAAVWFFDHEFCKEERLDAGFDSWLSSYLKLKNEREPNQTLQPTAATGRG